MHLEPAAQAAILTPALAELHWTLIPSTKLSVLGIFLPLHVFSLQFFQIKSLFCLVWLLQISTSFASLLYSPMFVTSPTLGLSPDLIYLHIHLKPFKINCLRTQELKKKKRNKTKAQPNKHHKCLNHWLLTKMYQNKTTYNRPWCNRSIPITW